MVDEALQTSRGWHWAETRSEFAGLAGGSSEQMGGSARQPSTSFRGASSESEAMGAMCV
jgi:hypothetical protein